MKIVRILSMLVVCLLLFTSCSYWGNPDVETYTRPETDADTASESLPESASEHASESATEPGTESDTEPGTATESATETETFKEVDPPPVVFTIREDLEAIEDVISVQGFSLAGVTGIKAYDMLYWSGDLQIAAKVILPEDYDEVSYPVILYFSDKVGMNDVVPTESMLAKSIVSKGAIVVQILARGQGDSTGATRLWGSDIQDAVKLMNICKSSLYLGGLKFYAVGSGEGSIGALRLAAEEDQTGLLRGCAVTNVISDLNAYIDAVDEATVNRIKAFLRNTNKPEEYIRRSAVSFADVIGVPVLVLNSETDTDIAADQSQMLVAKLMEYGKELSVKSVSSDPKAFLGEDAVNALFDWITSVR